MLYFYYSQKGVKNDKKNNVVYSNNKTFYYVRAYDSDNNTELFVCSNDKNISSIIEKLSAKAYSYKDKAAYNKYNADFYTYASEVYKTTSD